jgi:hypothetical protein
MAVRRLADPAIQPKSFAFTVENLDWREIAKYPQGCFDGAARSRSGGSRARWNVAIGIASSIRRAVASGSSIRIAFRLSGVIGRDSAIIASSEAFAMPVMRGLVAGSKSQNRIRCI